MSGIDSYLSDKFLYVTLGKLTSLCFDFPTYKVYLPHRVVEQIKCITIRYLEKCFVHSKHSDVSFKNMSVFCGVGEGYV